MWYITQQIVVAEWFHKQLIEAIMNTQGDILESQCFTELIQGIAYHNFTVPVCTGYTKVGYSPALYIIQQTLDIICIVNR